MRNLDLDQERRIKKRRWLKKIGLIVGFLVLLGLLGGGFVLWQGDLLTALFSPISFVARLINPTRLKETDGRVNALILGLDTRNGGGLRNTDTILVGSISVAEGDPALISIPRDFWLNLAPYGYGRINSAYSYGGTQKDGTFDAEKGIAFAKSKVEGILGISIPYWVLVDFEGFKEIINTLEGIEVCVETAFDDYSYPVPGHEADPVISHRYEHLHFDAGCQTMTGEVALKYARARIGIIPIEEGSDFARLRRQQKVILAVKDKVLSLSLLLNPGKIIRLYTQFTKATGTNASLAETQRALELLHDFQGQTEAKTLVLDPESGLTFVGNPALYGGAYVLVPKGGSFEAIHQAVRELLFGSVEEVGGE